MANLNITIKEQYFFNNGDLLLPSIKDSAGRLLQSGIEFWLNTTYDLQIKDHTEGGVTRQGLDASDLNKALRDRMTCISGIHGETYIEYGAILRKAKKGFDFSLFDEEYNIIKLRNAFIGNPGRYNGDIYLEDLYKKVLQPNNTTYDKRKWKQKLASLTGAPGQNIIASKKQYTVVGEIQFGNWAIVRHDLLRLLNSSIDGEIDYYVYITATGSLEKKLSGGIVSYSNVVQLFNENKQLIKTPIWVIGIDVDD